MKSKNSFRCIYFENEVSCESDNVAIDELENYFIDSFMHHIGRNPSTADIKKYLSHSPVVKQCENMTHHWENF
jgi:hypothetical protein